MRWLSLSEVLMLHHRLIEQSGGASGLRDLGLLEAAIAQPKQTFAGIDLYPSLSDKAACLGFSLIQNHPFVDGNKRIGHAAMETTLVLNRFELMADVVTSEVAVLNVASGQWHRETFTAWVAEHLKPLDLN